MKIKKINGNIMRQVFLISLILFIGLSLIYTLRYFIPGALGAITLYIIFRKTYTRLTEQKKWKKSLASTFLIVISLVALIIPLWLLVEILIPQITSIFDNKELINTKFNAVKAFMRSKPVLKNINLSEQALAGYVGKLAAYVPLVFNSIGSVVVNIATALFILYFMQVNSKVLEKVVSLHVPFSDDNKQTLWDETKMMVKSNALGIPIIALFQGIIAAIGYWIFGVNNALLWGLITGIATIVPVVGTMLIWVPIVIIHMSMGQMTNGILLAVYCVLVVGSIDNILRFTILRKLGDVPPLITVFGVLAGLNLFGMMGLIFGPLLLSYFLLLLKVYRTEFGKKQELMMEIEAAKDEKIEVEQKETITTTITAEKKDQPPVVTTNETTTTAVQKKPSD